MTADDAWHALSASLENSEPLCNGDDLFTADHLSDEDCEWCASICARCPVFEPCDAYASAAADSGFWAGAERSAKRRKAQANQSTTPAPDGIRQPSQPKESS